MADSGTEKEGGQQVGIGPAAAAEYGPAAGLLVFLVGAALLALLGLGTEAGVVETQAIVAAASGRPRGGPPNPLPRNGEGERRAREGD